MVSKNEIILCGFIREECLKCVYARYGLPSLKFSLLDLSLNLYHCLPVFPPLPVDLILVPVESLPVPLESLLGLSCPCAYLFN
jgi:hypothetical protein